MVPPVVMTTMGGVTFCMGRKIPAPLPLAIRPCPQFNSGCAIKRADHRALQETCMEFRPLGGSGFKVPVLSLGTGTFGGKGALFSSWGQTDVKEASRLVDISLEA